MDQGSERGQHNVVGVMCAILWVHGQRMGWIRVHHELAAIARVRVNMHGTIQRKIICELHDLVCTGNAGKHASPICGILAN